MPTTYAGVTENDGCTLPRAMKQTVRNVLEKEIELRRGELPRMRNAISLSDLATFTEDLRDDDD